MSTDVRTVITAAGDSRRLFLDAGFGTIKSLVEWRSRPVLFHAIDSYYVGRGSLAVAVNEEESRLFSLGEKVVASFPQARIVDIASGLPGALISTLLSIDSVDDRPLIVAAGDSAIVGGIGQFANSFLESEWQAATITFDSSDCRWSFVALDEFGYVQQVAEKTVIGSLATTGVFFFRTTKSFYEAATWCLVNAAHHDGNYYLSTTLNYFLAHGKTVGHFKIDRSMYRSWSLPADFAERQQF